MFRSVFRFFKTLLPKARFRTDFLSLAVASIALVLSLWQGYEQRAHNHISVEPRINSYFSTDGKLGKWGIYVFNNGLGPAFIDEFEVFVDGELVSDHEWGPFYSAVVALGLKPLCFKYGNPRKNDSFEDGSEQFLIEAADVGEVERVSCSKDWLLLMKYQSKRLDFRVEFSSIYDYVFEYRYSENEQRKV